MIHLSGLDPVERALKEIEIYETEGLDGIIVENYHGTIDEIIEERRKNGYYDEE